MHVCASRVQIVVGLCAVAICIVSCSPHNGTRPPAGKGRQLLQQEQRKIVGPDAQLLTGGYDFNVLFQTRAYHQITHARIDSYCTGTLITPYHVLTAAHCLHNALEVIHALDVVVGAYRLSQGANAFGAGSGAEGPNVAFVYGTKFRYMKPYGFGWTGAHEYDIAVLLLKEPVRGVAFPTLAVTTSPTDLAQPLPVGSEVFAIGWGAQNDLNFSAGSERLAGLTTTTASCTTPLAPRLADRWGPNKDDPRRPPKFICLGGPTTVGSPCYGDSGGPLLVNNVVWGVLTNASLDITAGRPSCMAPYLDKTGYVNVAAPAVAQFIQRAIAAMPGAK